MYVVKEQERRVRSCLFFPFLHVLWPLLIGISLDVIEAQCMGTWLQVTEDQSPSRPEQEPWLVEKSQECERGENKFSLVYVKDSAHIFQLCV